MFYDHLTVSSENGAFRVFEALDFGQVSLSVQASSLNYCSPRELLQDLSLYTSWEIAFIDKDRGMANPEDIPALNSHMFWGIRSMCYGLGEVVAYVSTEKVQKIFLILCSEFGKPKNTAKFIPELRTVSALQCRLGQSSSDTHIKESPIHINTSALRGRTK